MNPVQNTIGTEPDLSNDNWDGLFVAASFFFLRRFDEDMNANVTES